MASIDNLANEITKELYKYAHLVEDEMETAKKEVSQELVDTLKKASPRRNAKNGGKYAKGWRAKTVGNAEVVYNTKYQLTHLLEKGHAKVNGGRVAPRVHIRPSEEKAIKEYLDRVEKAIKQ